MGDELVFDGSAVWTKCVDVPGNDYTNGNVLQIWDCAGWPQQLWGYDAWMGTVFLASSTGDASKCFDLQNGGLENGTPVQIWDCIDSLSYGNENQQWDMSFTSSTISM